MLVCLEAVGHRTNELSFVVVCIWICTRTVFLVERLAREPRWQCCSEMCRWSVVTVRSDRIRKIFVDYVSKRTYIWRWYWRPLIDYDKISQANPIILYTNTPSMISHSLQGHSGRVFRYMVRRCARSCCGRKAPLMLWSKNDLLWHRLASTSQCHKRRAW